MNKLSSKKNSNTNKSSKPKVKKTKHEYIYFDNNASTKDVCEPAKKAVLEWLSCYNPSSDSKMAKPVKQLIESSCDYVLQHCNVSSATHTAIFTSGATESNCLMVRACVKAYKKTLLEKDSTLRPHIIISAMEHHSIIECAKDLEETGEVDVDYVYPTMYGNILAEDVEKLIKPNTCLICVMAANNEVPVISDIKSIGEIAHKHKVPLHSDCVQVFGKYPIDIVKNNIDSLSASGHKLYAPKGIGILVVNNILIEGYNLTGEINGSQQHGLRGGTENISGIASFVAALKNTFISREKKNRKLFKLRDYCLEKLKQCFDFAEYESYYGVENITEKPDLELISLGPPQDKKRYLLPNTVLLAICKNKGKPFCNIELKKYLDSKGIVVSIGSACLTKSDKASHVLSAIDAPPVVKRGVIRISFGDKNTTQEVNQFVKILEKGILQQCKDVKLDKKAEDLKNENLEDE